MANSLEEKGARVVVGCDPTFGACDLRDKEAKALGCDLLLHVGHSDFGVEACLPVRYLPYELEVDVMPLIEKHLPSLEAYKTISLVSSLQFSSVLEPAKRVLENAGKHVLFEKQVRNKKHGLILGCDWTAALPLEGEVDCYLFIGSGKFHPLGLARQTSKPVLSLDVETGKLKDYIQEKQRLENVKAFHRAEARDAQNFGILLTTKEGQQLVRAAEETKRLLEKKGKRAWILVMDEITPEKLLGLKLDVLVNCACPRIDEDFSLFKKPVLNPQDVLSL